GPGVYRAGARAGADDRPPGNDRPARPHRPEQCRRLSPYSSALYLASAGPLAGRPGYTRGRLERTSRPRGDGTARGPGLVACSAEGASRRPAAVPRALLAFLAIPAPAWP